ncbi:MAG: ATP-binding protein [Opitutaceae bacterium]
MRHWSLKIKFGVYAAGLVLVALAVAAAVTLPAVYFNQLRQLDRQLAGEAEELFRDLENFRGAPINPRRPLSARFIPVAMHDRLIVLKGPEGQLLYASPGLDDEDLEQVPSGFATILVGAEPFRIGVFRNEPFHLEVGASVAPLQALQAELVRAMAVAAPLTALVVFGLGFWLAKYAIRPVSALTAAAERISVNRLSETLPMPPTRDEIARLTEVLNDAFGRLKESYEVATRFSADASHQLKTPLAVLRLGLGALRANPDLPDDLRSEVDLLLRQTRRLTLLINELLLLAQADAGRLVLERKQVVLNPMIEAAMDDVETLTRDRGIEVETRLPEDLSVTVDQGRFRMALQIITENAAKYTPDGGRIRLKASIKDGFLRLNLANTGKGIPDQDHERIFERFHRGTSVGEETEGHGLGLNIARTLFRAHQGDLKLVRSDGEWTEFQLTIPV